MNYEEYFQHLQGLRKTRDVVIGTLPGPRPLVYEHGRILSTMIQKAAKCLGLTIVDLRMAHGMVEVDGKKRRAYRYAFDVVLD